VTEVKPEAAKVEKPEIMQPKPRKRGESLPPPPVVTVAENITENPDVLTNQVLLAEEEDILLQIPESATVKLTFRLQLEGGELHLEQEGVPLADALRQIKIVRDFALKM